MLRSIQTLRESAPAARRVADSHDHLALFGGGGDYHTPWHWHDGLMIMLPRIGAVDFRDERRHSGAWVSEERFVVAPKMLAHQTAARRTGRTHDHLALYVTDDQLAAIDAQLGSLSRVRAKLKAPALFATSPQMRALLGLCESSTGADRAAQSVRAHLIAALLLNCLTEIEHGEEISAANRASHGDAVVAEMQAYIADHLGDALPLDRIADAFGLSRRHATRMFRDKTGMSIGAFHDQARIDCATRLLGSTDLPVGDIAGRIGLDSGAALARMMRRVAGLSPSEARRMARSDKH